MKKAVAIVVIGLIVGASATMVIRRGVSATQHPAGVQDDASVPLPDSFWIAAGANSKVPDPDLTSLPALPAKPGETPFPSGNTLAPYLLAIGYRTGVTDEQAAWLLRITHEHPDYNIAVSSVRGLGLFFSGGGRDQGPRSRVSRANRDLATEELLEGLASKDSIRRRMCASTVAVCRLWLLYPEFTDAFVSLKDDPDANIRDTVKSAMKNRDLSGYIRLN